MSYDAVVIGAGPAGYVCAIRLGQLGQKVAIVEGRHYGGVCLNVGCIPSKALISAAKLVHKAQNASDMGITIQGLDIDVKKLVEWKNKIVHQLTSGVKTLLEKNGVDLVPGVGRVSGPNRVEVTSENGVQVIDTKNIVVATGSKPIEIPGFAFADESVWSSTEALEPTKLPGHMLVIGGGYIGLELGFVYRNLGCEVTVVEFMDRVLPGMDPELSKEMTKSLKKRKIKVLTNAKAKSYEKRGDKCVVTIELEGGKTETVECDVILSSVGRKPNGKGIGLEEAGVDVTDRGFVPVDAQRRTRVPSIYAIGDITEQPMLAHKGSAEGLVAAAAIAGDAGAAYDPAAIPLVVFTDPEIASVGLTEDEAREAGFDPVVGKFPFRASGRALSLGETDGWTKVVADRETDKVLGVHMIGPEVTELIAEATLAIEMGATCEDIAMTIHAHPTLPESIMEAAEAVHKMAVHILS
ncbi:MAG: dihydrolipoyl dehydrogenase [Planctomycetes bacterium]|nr:dihydrolipoyl dehydrogenase [Planctomycetota bacterium]